jgi:hypothetical protein
MNAALNWIRSKARHTQTELMVVSPDEATAAECEPGTYQIERFVFEGFIPFRMARALSGATLTKTDAEHEALHLGTGYRGGEGACRYYRSIYTLVATAE